MVTAVRSLGLQGISGYEVTVECFLSGGLPAFDIVGLGDMAVKESRERVRAAVKNCGVKFPVSRITVNLAPAGRKKEGTLYDLPILLGILTAAEELRHLPEDAAFLGELSLTGALRPVTGVLPMALCARRLGLKSLYVPAENAAEAATDETAQKIIYNASLSMESTDFDTTREALMTAVEANGAWLESTSLYGTEKDHDRTADYTVRVPVGSYRAFLAAVGDAGSVLNISESAENITSSYIDVQARLSALEAQRDRLNALADQAETTADLLEIESQLSDVQYQLENYTRQLRSMDQQVSYSTVDIYLREVATLTPTGVTFGERIADAFGGGWDAFVGFLQGLVIALVYLWPVLLIAVVVVFILRKVWKKRPKKEKLPKPAQTPPPAEYPVKPGDAPKPKY